MPAPVRRFVALCMEAGTFAGVAANCCMMSRHGTPGGVCFITGSAIAAEQSASIGELIAASATAVTAMRFVVLDIFSQPSTFSG